MGVIFFFSFFETIKIFVISGQQPPIYQSAPQAMSQAPVMMHQQPQMTPGMPPPPQPLGAPPQQDPQAPKPGSNAQALAELISFD